jgi:hypothetical protein
VAKLVVVHGCAQLLSPFKLRRAFPRVLEFLDFANGGAVLLRRIDLHEHSTIMIASNQPSCLSPRSIAWDD